MKLRRWLPLLLLPLLLISCSKPHRFTKSENGAYIDQRTDIAYTLLDAAFEPANAGEEWGMYEDENSDFVRTFHTVEGLDPSLFLADDMLCVYYAGEDELKPQDWTVTAALLCFEDEKSIEQKRFTAAEHAAVIAELHTLWFSGEGNAEMPEFESPVYERRIKLAFAEYPSLYYCFTFAVYENGAGFLYEIASERTVALPAAFVEALRNG